MKTGIFATLNIAVGLFTAASAVALHAAVPIDTFGTVIDQPGHYVLTADLAAGVLGPFQDIMSYELTPFDLSAPG